MAIPQTKYVNIISAVGGTSAVSTRDLIARIFTSNKLVPTGSVLEFTGGSSVALSEVGKHFGILSNEYYFAKKYFSFVGKKATQPQKISFYHYNTEATPAYLIGSVKSAKLEDFKQLSNTDVTFHLDGVSFALSSLDLTDVVSMDGVAMKISTALETAGYDDDLAFEYDETNNRFILSSVAVGSGYSLLYATGTLAPLFGMSQGTIGCILSDSGDVETAVESLSASAELSNNFFSFAFLPSVSGQEVSIAEWVKAQNVRYMWSVQVGTANASDMSSMLGEYDGVALTLDKYAEHAEYIPMAVAASVDFNNANAGVNFMYQQASGITPSVTSSAEQSAYDALKINYYGTTQQAGQPVSFYQDGVLLGSISDMGVFLNEAWLKDAIFAELLNLRLGLDTLPATSTGLGLVKASIQAIIEKGLYNGVINPGKTLDSVQKAYVAQLTGDSKAWMSIQTSGYYLSAKIEKYIENGVEKYKVSYLLVYAKGDSINFIDGRDILI